MFNSEQDLNRYYMQKYCNYQLRGNFFLDMNPLVKMYFFFGARRYWHFPSII